MSSDAARAGRSLAGIKRANDARTRRHCIDDVSLVFPFHGYMEPMRDAYEAVAADCSKLLAPGARILDYGAGPCDKTAVLARLGYECTAIDDLSDDWHQVGDNREKIREFAKAEGVQLIVANHVPETLPRASFAMVMVHDVIEHLADSPRALLLKMIELLQPGGYLYVTVPNAVNLRKRLLVLSGRTNYPRYPAYFWSGDVWRGHKREYVKDDLTQLCKYMGLAPVLLEGQHHRMGALPPYARGLFRFTIGRIDSLRDTLALIGQRPAEWKAPEISRGEYHEILEREMPYRFEK